MDFDVIALAQLEHIHDCGGKAYGQAVAPFRNLHGSGS
jgi:hypothetical protein